MAPRVKVLQHASETADVSSLSPDHAVTVDPILAKQIEIIRGPSTLLYSAGTVGGLVNVTDQKFQPACLKRFRRYGWITLQLWQ